jgi:hypothetical protein
MTPRKVLRSRSAAPLVPLRLCASKNRLGGLVPCETLSLDHAQKPHPPPPWQSQINAESRAACAPPATTGPYEAKLRPPFKACVDDDSADG